MSRLDFSTLSWNPQEATQFLSKNDKKLAPWIERVGVIEFKPGRSGNPFQSLAESILYQQLAGKAAAAIVNRLKASFGSTELPTPELILSVPETHLRACGISQAKMLAIRDLADKTVMGKLPSIEDLKRMEEEDIIEQLTQVRGIGRWTAEMFLISSLGRSDILPLNDYGIRKGFAKVFGLKSAKKDKMQQGKQATDKKVVLPSPQEIALRGERWRPYRTMASLFLWRVLDLKE